MSGAGSQRMPINNTTWNRIRYGAAAPVYDLLTTPLQYMGFKAARQRAFELLSAKPGERLLIVGAGTGLDRPCDRTHGGFCGQHSCSGICPTASDYQQISIPVFKSIG